jgi:alpha-L-arabinofuranosidase
MRHAFLRVHCATVATFTFFLFATLATTSCQRATVPAITTIAIGPEVLHTGVKHFGINLSGQSFYDSGQMLRNLIFRNPGFEGETWQSILRCQTVSGKVCIDRNVYTTWPAGFLNGARYEILSGAAAGTAGTISNSTAATTTQGVAITLSNSTPAAGDFILVRAEKPGNADAGWWVSTQSGATISTELRDLSPETPGKQALRVDASGPGQSAVVNSYFDTLEGHSFVQLHGRFTLDFRAKLINSNGIDKFVIVKLERLDTRHGLHIFFNKSIPLTDNWRDYSFDIAANEDGSAVGSVGLTFTVAHASMLLDDVSLTAAAAPNNPTAFRDEVVQTLRDLHPGVLRYMDNGANFGSSLDNMLAPPFARQRTGASTQATSQEDIPIGLHEFLTLAKAVGAEPWYAMQPGMSTAEAANLIEYLAGPETTRYGKIRAALGQRQPWTSVFPAIHLELGNEQWNRQSFSGSTIDDPTAYGQRAAKIFAAMRQAPAFDRTRFDLVLGTWTTVPWWTQQEMASSSGFDSIAVAPYLFNDFNDSSSTEAVFGPMFAQPEMLDSRPDGYMAQQAKLLKTPGAPSQTAPSFQVGTHKPNLAVYEVNLGSMTGSASITQADLNADIPSMGAGLAVADHMLLMLRDLGITTQCLFSLPEYMNRFSGPGPQRTMPLWGAVVDMGGATNLRRPQFLTEQLANQAILPTMLSTHIAGPPHEWNQPKSANDKIELDRTQMLQTFAFTDGTRHSLILLNLSRGDAIPVVFSGPSKPSGTVARSVLTSLKIDATNESVSAVATQRNKLPAFDPSQPYSLPPFSMTVLEWRSR